MRNRIARPTSRRGTVAVITALLMISLMGFTAMAIDISWLVSVTRELQTTADVAALAGARKVRTDIPYSRQLAWSLGETNWAAGQHVPLDLNEPNDPAGDIVVGRWDGTAFTPTVNDLPSPNAVKVVARRTNSSLGGPLPLLFGSLIGKDQAEPWRDAIATVEGSTGAGIIALCPDCQCAFRVNGDPLIDVGDASIQVNSMHQCGACGDGNPTVMAAELNLNGPQWCETGGNVNVQADINLDVDPVPDPLAGLPPPNYNPIIDPDLSCTYFPGATLNPGYYSIGIAHTSGLLNLNPGVYILDGPNVWIPLRIEEAFDARAVGTSVTTLDGSTWVGGSVASYAVVDPPPTQYPLATTVENSYAVGAGLTITFNPPLEKVSFFFVHDSMYGFNVPQGNVDAIDLCEDTISSKTSKQATVFNDSANLVLIKRAHGAPPIRRLVFTNGGVIDSFKYTRTDPKGGLHIGGGSTFVAHGVMFYIAGGGVDIQGNSLVQITPIDSNQYTYTNGEEVYDGVSFFQARNNPDPPSNNVNDADFMGTSDTEIYGQLYFPAAGVEIGGTSLALGNGIIARTIWLHGTADSFRNLDPLTDPNLRVFLVK